MITLADFRTLFPEFTASPDALVQACLDQAETRTDADVFGDLTDEAHGWLAADILASRPFGRASRVGKDNTGETVYAIKRAELERLCCAFYGTV